MLGAWVRKEGTGGRGRQTYPATLTEPTLKEGVEGHRVLPTAGQTAVCEKDRVSEFVDTRGLTSAAQALSLTALSICAGQSCAEYSVLCLGLSSPFSSIADEIRYFGVVGHRLDLV